MMNIEITRLIHADLPLAHHALTILRTGDNARAHPIDNQALDSFLQDQSNLLLMAFNNGSPAACLLGYLLPRIDRPEPMLYIHDIEVAESCQRKGIGTALLQFARDLGRTIPVAKVFLLTDTNNTPALRLYQAAKLRRDDTAVLFEWPGGEKSGDSVDRC